MSLSDQCGTSFFPGFLELSLPGQTDVLAFLTGLLFGRRLVGSG